MATDIENFRTMFTQAGVSFTEHVDMHWVVALHTVPESNRIIHQTPDRGRTFVTVEVPFAIIAGGQFYDDLRVAFDIEGRLLDINSHVMSGAPSTTYFSMWLGGAT